LGKYKSVVCVLTKRRFTIEDVFFPGLLDT
jgi:hypothetical protein